MTVQGPMHREVIAHFPHPTRLLVPEGLWREMIRIVESRYPVEACGALFGELRGGEALLKEVVELTNIYVSSRRFWIDEAEWMRAIMSMRRRGLEYIGLFHSHGGEAISPSMSDLHRMIECPGEVWVIIRYSPPQRPAAAAWTIGGYGAGLTPIEMVLL